MDDDEKKAVKDVAKIGGDSIANVGIGLGVSFALTIMLGLIGLPYEVSSTLTLGIMLGIIFGEPMAVWRGERSWRRFAFYFGAGVGISALIDLAVMADPDTFTTAEDGEVIRTDEVGSFNFPWFILIIVLTGPLVFALPVLEKILKVEKDVADVTKEEIAISMAFPILMSVTMFLHLAVPGALWLIGAPLWLAAGLYLLAIALVVADVAYSPEEDSARDLLEQWGPRPETAEESWANLRKGLGQSIASSLFLGSILYISLSSLWGQVDLADLDDGGLALLGSLLAFAGLMLGLTLLLMALGSALTVGFALLVGRIRFRDPISMVELAERSVARLYMGGMSWVRPDLPDDNPRQ